MERATTVHDARGLHGAVVQMAARPDAAAPSGTPTVAFDGPSAMLGAHRGLRLVPDTHCVQGEVEHLPLTRCSFGGSWPTTAYSDVRREWLPLALWDLHRVLTVGAPLAVQVPERANRADARGGDPTFGDDFPAWTADRLADIVAGAGFDVEAGSVDAGDGELRLRARRARTLADTVGPGMRVLVCGVNPSFYSADAGVGYARPGNRFWPAMVAARVVSRDRDALDALVRHRVGMTDFAKRPTRTAAEISTSDYRHGMDRIERLAEWLRPGAICFTGLSGWRSVVKPKATAGVQPETIGGRPVYVVPSTSGLNARTSLDQLVEHFRLAAELADRR